MRVINMIAIPCAIGLSLFSYPILELMMFEHKSVVTAAPWLSVSAISVIFLGIIASTNAFLNTTGKQRLPIISMLVGAGAKLISNYFLVEQWGMYGAPISTIICYLCAASMNIYFTIKYVGKLPSIKKSILLPFLCGIIAIGGSALIYWGLTTFMMSRIATVICILSSVLVYLLLILKTKIVTEEEIAMLPKGENIIKLLKKVRFLS